MWWSGHKITALQTDVVAYWEIELWGPWDAMEQLTWGADRPKVRHEPNDHFIVCSKDVYSDNHAQFIELDHEERSLLSGNCIIRHGERLVTPNAKVAVEMKDRAYLEL